LERGLRGPPEAGAEGFIKLPLEGELL